MHKEIDYRKHRNTGESRVRLYFRVVAIIISETICEIHTIRYI